MASALTLDTNDNPDLADSTADCKLGEECQLTVTATLRSDKGGIRTFDVSDAEYEDSGEDSSEPGEEPMPMKKKMAPAISKLGAQMM